jgi:hypothetical protein
MASINAAASAIARFYLAAAAAAAFALVTEASVSGQSSTIPEQPLLGSALTADMLRQLPASGTPFAVLDAMQTEAISDRFVAGGLNSATPPRVGGFLNSWTQTQVRFGDITITDPRTGGTPLLVPLLPVFSRMQVTVGALGIEESAAAVSMNLEPLRAGTTWVRAFEGSLSGGFLTPGAVQPIPAVDRVDHLADGSFAISGPVSPRVGLAAAGSWRNLSHVASTSGAPADEHVGSAFVQTTFAATPVDAVRVIGWLQGVSTPDFDDRGLHVQGAWERHRPDRLRWRAYAGYTERKRSAAPIATSITVDSLTSDPISELFDTGAGTSRTWTLGARISHPRKWFPSGGIEVHNARVRVDANGIGEIREVVDGTPSRLWTLTRPSATDGRHLSTVSGFVNEQLVLGPVTIDGGLRIDHAAGAADQSVNGVNWTSLLPRALAEWRVVQKFGIRLIAGYRRSAYQMPLNVLAIGDAAAPVADIARWTGGSAGTPIARVGPGTGGDPSLTSIDPALKRPITDELTLAVRTRPFRSFEVELARVTKRESPRLSLEDPGVPFSSYTAFAVPDPYYNPATAGKVDVPFTVALDRPAGMYGRDRYLLTNAADDPESWALELNTRTTTERLTLLTGIALTWAKGPAAAIGFLPTENDQNVLGNLFVDANRVTYARGQLFQDRSHAAKIGAIYRFAGGLTVGALARYLDGQPFARLVAVNDGLTQGPTLVRVFRNGGQAFCYQGTLDVRVQRAFRMGRATLTAGFDVYNLPGLQNEVSEYVVGGPRFRESTETQPPRTGLVSVRVVY